MTASVKPIAETTTSDAFGLVKTHTFELRRRNGEWQRQVRETYDRGDGAAVLLCNVAQHAVILIRQFRYPAFYRGENPYLIEACAGKLEGDGPEACARREALEETGYRVDTLERAFDCYASPGSVTEKLTLFIGRIDATARVAPGGGLDTEGEDIEVLTVDFEAALAMIATGEIADAKTILLLQHARLQGVFA